jgi:hypothetical protein
MPDQVSTGDGPLVSTVPGGLEETYVAPTGSVSTTLTLS